MLDRRIIEIDLPVPDEDRHFGVEQEMRVLDASLNTSFGTGKRFEAPAVGVSRIAPFAQASAHLLDSRRYQQRPSQMDA